MNLEHEYARIKRVNQSMKDIIKNPSAVALGKLAKGRPKNYSQAELKRRKERLAIARSNRWPKKDENSSGQ